MCRPSQIKHFQWNLLIPWLDEKGSMIACSCTDLWLLVAPLTIILTACIVSMDVTWMDVICLGFAIKR